MGKIILSADSTCDIGPALQKKYNVHYFHFHIQVGDQTYTDMVDIQPEDLYAAWREKGILPKTAAITPDDYRGFFRQWVEDGFEVIHLNLGSGISSAHQNCCLVAEELGHVYPVDSANLSAGLGHLVIKAGELIRQGLPAPEIQARLIAMRERVQTSFILDTLEFMKAGGRCSAVTAFGANLLRLKPCIEVDSRDGSHMKIGKKYRGSMEKVLPEYVRDKLADRGDVDLDRVMIVSSGSPDSDIQLAKDEVARLADFREVYVTRANGTISTHCGPRTLGVIFMTKEG